MSDTNASEVHAENINTSDGAKGLAMAVPVVGLPALIHAVSGLLVTGIGVAPIILASGFLANQFLPDGMNIGDMIQKINQSPDRKSSNPVSVTATKEKST